MTIFLYYLIALVIAISIWTISRKISFQSFIDSALGGSSTPQLPLVSFEYSLLLVILLSSAILSSFCSISRGQEIIIYWVNYLLINVLLFVIVLNRKPSLLSYSGIIWKYHYLAFISEKIPSKKQGINIFRAFDTTARAQAIGNNYTVKIGALALLLRKSHSDFINYCHDTIKKTKQSISDFETLRSKAYLYFRGLYFLTFAIVFFSGQLMSGRLIMLSTNLSWMKINGLDTSTSFLDSTFFSFSCVAPFSSGGYANNDFAKLWVLIMIVTFLLTLYLLFNIISSKIETKVNLGFQHIIEYHKANVEFHETLRGIVQNQKIKDSKEKLESMFQNLDKSQTLIDEICK